MADEVEGSGEADIFGKHELKTGMFPRHEIRQDAEPRALQAPVKLHDQTVGSEFRLPVTPEEGEIVQFPVEDHVRDVTDTAQVVEVGKRSQRTGPFDEIGPRVETEAVIADLVDRETARRGRRGRDREIGITLRELERPGSATTWIWRSGFSRESNSQASVSR